MLKTKDFYYDEHYDCYLCENNQVLRYRTTTRDGYREYVSNPFVCETCPLLSQCTQSRDYKKAIHRHLWQEAMDYVEHLRHTVVNHALEPLSRAEKNDASSDAYFHCLKQPQKACELVLGFPRESMSSLRFNRKYIQQTLISITK